MLYVGFGFAVSSAIIVSVWDLMVWYMGGEKNKSRERSETERLV
jgi:hypothetical protein